MYFGYLAKLAAKSYTFRRKFPGVPVYDPFVINIRFKNGASH